jgi:hypothetical protein
MISLKNSASDIRFWIVLFFLLRLYGITNPPLEIAHSWRQVTVNMSARNFFEIDNTILYPRVDFAGDKTGITGMEFPILNYLIYLVSLVFGYAHWYGRFINLILSSIGLWYFFLIIKKYFTPTLAFNATFMLLFSAWFTYSRKIMPDTFSMSFMLMGVYYGSNYLDTKKNLKNLMLYFIFIVLGALSKLPSMYVLIVFCPFLLNKHINFKTKLPFCLVSLVISALVGMYYFKWVPYLTERFGFYHFFMGKSIAQGFQEILNNLETSFEKFYLEALQIIGFILFLIGLTIAITKKDKKILAVFSLCLAAYLVVVFKAGITFSRHSYYIVPFAPAMALLAAYTLESIHTKKFVILILALILIESISNKFHDFSIKDEYSAILNLEPKLDGIGGRNELIAINSGEVPTPMYFAHRKGWIDFNEKLADTSYVKTLKIQGLKRIVILKKVFGEDIRLPYKRNFENDDFVIYTP